MTTQATDTGQGLGVRTASRHHLREPAKPRPGRARAGFWRGPCRRRALGQALRRPRLAFPPVKPQALLGAPTCFRARVSDCCLGETRPARESRTGEHHSGYEVASDLSGQGHGCSEGLWPAGCPASGTVGADTPAPPTRARAPVL